jgi:hypothetical protein
LDNEQIMHAMSLDDSYRVERVLAHDKVGVTELVFLDDAGPFIRKRIPKQLANRGMWAALAGIGCRRLPRIEATYEMPDEYVVVHDFIPGSTLGEEVESKGRLEAQGAVHVALDLCEAAGTLHEHGIVHTDITPSNVIIAADGAHLIDFGIARLISDEGRSDMENLGTWGFAAPEQYGFAKVDARSDIYAIGRVLGYALTGIFPDAKNEFEDALENPDLVPRRLREVILKATAFEPSGRYQSTRELAAALQPLDAQQASAAPDAPCASEVARVESDRAASEKAETLRAAAASSGMRHPRRLQVLIAAAIGLAAALAIAFGHGASPSDAVTEEGQDAAQASSPAEGESDAPQAAPSEEENGGSSAGTDAEVALEVASTEWFCSDGHVHIVYALRNPSTTCVELPGADVSGTADDGTVLFSVSDALAIIGPGQTVYRYLLSDSPQAPDSVNVEVHAPRPDQLDASASATSYSVSDVSAREQYGLVYVTGRVGVESAGKSAYGSDGVRLCVVLRDSSGRMVGCGDGYLDSRPEEGSSSTFQVIATVWADYETCEAYAYDW